MDYRPQDEAAIVVTRLGDPTPLTIDALIDLIIARLGDPAPTTIDAILDLIQAETDNLANVQYTRPYVIEEVEFDDVAAVGPTNLSTLSITPVFPTGSTKVKAYLVAHIFISNQTANAQNVTPSISAQVNGGGFNNIWAPGDIMTSVPASSGTATMLLAECDISAYFVDGQATDLYFIVTQTSANSVHYTSQATIFLVYTM